MSSENNEKKDIDMDNMDNMGLTCKKLVPLSDISGVTKLQEIYEKNFLKKWSDWLEFDTFFEKPGKQGLVGLLSIKNDKNTKKIIFKISQYINYLVHHEYTIMKGLNELSPYCPHFCKVVGTLLCEVDAKCRKNGNPFELTSNHPIEKEVLLTEYLDKSCKFYNYIRSAKIKDDVIYASIKQVLLAITIAQREKQFTHYDLHSFNIMMKKCDKDVVFLYVIDDENQFLVPTYGYYPVIIDFGFSYSNDLEDCPLWPSMGHTEVGFMSDRFDWVADPKLFLVTVAKELWDKRKNKTSEKFRRIVKNIFGRLKIDWQSGWDTDEEKSASDFVTEMLEGYNGKSNLFDNYDYLCVDIIQTLIILPLEEQKYDNIHNSYTTFLTEFTKIENEIGNPFYNLYILKGVVDIARDIRKDYLSQDTREHAVKWFQRCVYERINTVAKFCKPKDIHFEKMLCSLLCLSKNIEGVLYDAITSRMSVKNKQYNKLPVKSVEQIYGAIEENIPSNYKYTENTKVYVMNCVSKKCDRIQLKKDICNEINNTDVLSKGCVLYDFYNKK